MALSISKTLTPAAIALFIVIVATANTAQSQTTSFFYDFYGSKPTTLTYQGDAHYPTDGTTFLRLTKTDDSGRALQNSAGRALYSTPISFWKAGAQVDLETTIKFRLRPNANSNNPADGVVFFIAPVGTTIPADSAGGSFGVFGPSGNLSNVFAVEFDIFVNGQWDPRFRHVGIDIESRNSVTTAQISDSLIGQEVTLRVNYVGATGIISVVVTASSYRQELSYVYDLSTILPQQVQVGIAASTGEYAAIHDVVAWYYTSTLVYQNRKIRQFI